MTETTLRPEIKNLPARMRGLKIARGYPVPWFVAWVDGANGPEPEFRAFDPRKMAAAIRQKLCWVCGEPLGRFMTFVIGPMCGINRVSSEPPCHRECAQFSAKYCPFLSKPQMVRREDAFTEANFRSPAGVMIERNPGVTLLWTTKSYRLSVREDGVLFFVGDPESLEFYAEGRDATRAEVNASIVAGLPALVALCKTSDDYAELVRLRRRLDDLLDRHAWPVARAETKNAELIEQELGGEAGGA
jgi:hypothetical protein